MPWPLAVDEDPWLPAGLEPERVVARAGLVSDTHVPDRSPEVPDALYTAMRGVDLLLHAGDVGSREVLTLLGSEAPLFAVHGNADPPELRESLPFQQVVMVGPRKVLLCHTHDPEETPEQRAARHIPAAGRGRPGSLEKRAALCREPGADTLVFGHSHMPMAVPYAGVWLVNPGTLAPPFPVIRQTWQTVARMYVRDDGAPFFTHIGLAEPERPLRLPGIDWQRGGGFRVASPRFVDLLLEEELAADWQAIQRAVAALPPEGALALRWATTLAAHRCTSGELERVSRSMLLEALKQVTGPAAGVRERVAAIVRGT